MVENFRSLVAAVTCKASTKRGGWSLAPIGQNIKAETYPEDAGRGGAAVAGAGARGDPERLSPGDARAPRRGRDRGPASGHARAASGDPIR